MSNPNENVLNNTGLGQMFKKGEIKTYQITPPPPTEEEIKQQQEQEKQKQQEEEKQKQQQEHKTEDDTPKLPEKPEDKWGKKEYRNLTIKLNTKHIGIIKAICERQDLREKALVETIFEEYFNHQNFDDDLKQRAKELTPKGQ